MSIGDPIPGSRYVRTYCDRCGDPMRVFPGKEHDPIFCGECHPKGLTDMAEALTQRQRTKLIEMRRESEGA